MIYGNNHPMKIKIVKSLNYSIKEREKKKNQIYSSSLYRHAI